MIKRTKKCDNPGDPAKERRSRLIRGIPWEQFVEELQKVIHNSMHQMTICEPSKRNITHPDFDPLVDQTIYHRFYPDEVCAELMRRTKKVNTTSNRNPTSPCGCFATCVVGSMIAGAVIGVWIYLQFFAP